MARVKEITVGMETSIKIREYQYIKPRIDIVYVLDESETPGKIMDEARKRLILEMAKMEKQIKKEHGSDNDGPPMPDL